MIRLFTPKNGIQLTILKSIFEAEGVPVFIENENVGAIRTGMFMEPFMPRTIMVSEEHYEKAAAIIQSFIDNNQLG